MNKTRQMLLSTCVLLLAAQPAYSFPLVGDKAPNWLMPLLYVLSIASALLILISIFALPFIIPRLYRAKAHTDDSEGGERRWSRTPWRLFLKALKNVIGVVLILAGIAMLVLPGQGLLTLVVGVALVDFPGKRALARKLRSYRLVAKAERFLRHRYDTADGRRGEKVDGNHGEDGRQWGER